MLGYIPPGADTPEQTPPSTVHAGRYGQQAGSTHPTGMHTCFLKTKGPFTINKSGSENVTFFDVRRLFFHFLLVR